jgi:hypothetical protein
MDGNPLELMTALDFRKSPERVSAWRELLTNNPTVAEVLVCLRDERPPTDVGNGADALASVRALAAVAQHDSDYNLLLSLAEPLPPEPEQEEPTWGVDKDRFQTK